jgi:hypothetical protein
VRGHDRRVREEGAQIRRGCRLPGLRAQGHQVCGEDRLRAQLAFDRHRGGDVGGGKQHRQVVDGEQQHPEHAVRAVDEGEPFLLAQDEWLDAGLVERRGGGDDITRHVAHVGFPHRRERDMRERSQVT